MLVNNAIADQFKKRMAEVERKYRNSPPQELEDEKDIMTVCFAAGHLRLDSIAEGNVKFKTTTPVSVRWDGKQFILAVKSERP